MALLIDRAEIDACPHFFWVMAKDADAPSNQAPYRLPWAVKDRVVTLSSGLA